MTYAVAACLLAGLLDAIGGAVKDSPSEGFKPLSFPRSILFAGLTAPLALLLADSIVITFLVNGYLTRAAVEVYKFFRYVLVERDPATYFRHERARRPVRFWREAAAKDSLVERVERGATAPYRG